MEKSLRQRIKDHLREWSEFDPVKWIHKGDIADLARQAGYSAENTGRRLRELEDEGAVEVRYNDKHHAMYRYKAQNDPVAMIWRESERMHQEEKQMILI